MYSNVAANKRKTYLIFAFFVAFVGLLGWLFSQYLGQPLITPYVLIGASIYALITYFAGSKMAVAVNGAKQIQKRDNPRLYRIVENLAITEGMPTPKVYIMEDPALNAFATGRIQKMPYLRDPRVFLTRLMITSLKVYGSRTLPCQKL